MSRWRSPTLDTLAIILVFHLVQQVTWLVVPRGIFTLGLAMAVKPWALVTSVYGHAGVGHLLANAIGLAVLGPLVARRTTRLRFHVFFLLTGILAGVGQVLISALLLSPSRVIGASGAIFALLGYLLSGNVVSSWALDRLDISPNIQLFIFLVVAVLVTFLTASPGTALIGHATGLLVGLVAGRLRVLDVANPESRREPQSPSY